MEEKDELAQIGMSSSSSSWCSSSSGEAELFVANFIIHATHMIMEEEEEAEETSSQPQTRATALNRHREDKVEEDEQGVCEAENVTTKGVEEERSKMEGMASIALLPDGSISGHFVRLPHSVCYGIHGTELACERECSRGEDYRLVKLTIIDFNSKKEQDVVVERRGHDAARLCNVDHAHGWEKDVVNLVDQKHQKNKIVISFECETLKADEAAEEHVRRFIPK